MTHPYNVSAASQHEATTIAWERMQSDGVEVAQYIAQTTAADLERRQRAPYRLYRELPQARGDMRSLRAQHTPAAFGTEVPQKSHSNARSKLLPSGGKYADTAIMQYDRQEEARYQLGEAAEMHASAQSTAPKECFMPGPAMQNHRGEEYMFAFAAAPESSGFPQKVYAQVLEGAGVVNHMEGVVLGTRRIRTGTPSVREEVERCHLERKSQRGGWCDSVVAARAHARGDDVTERLRDASRVLYL